MVQQGLLLPQRFPLRVQQGKLTSKIPLVVPQGHLTAKIPTDGAAGSIVTSEIPTEGATGLTHLKDSH